MKLLYKESHTLILLLTLITIGMFYLSNVTDGHDWGGDFSQYIHHAENITEGTNYTETGYIFNPEVPQNGPENYPPIFPILLTPVNIVFGLDLTVMKIETILMFLLALSVVFIFARKELNYWYAIGLVAILGFNPFFFSFTSNVLSDIPFLVFIYLALFAINRAYNKDSFSIRQTVLIALLVYLATATRSVGIVLFPCIVVYEVAKYRRIPWFSIKVGILLMALLGLQSLLIPNGSDYRTEITNYDYTATIFLKTAQYYTAQLGTFWDNGYSNPLRKTLWLVVSLFAALGFFRRLRNGIECSDLFLIFYLLIVFAWPTRQGMRFLIPVLPLYLYYSLIAFQGVLADFRPYHLKRFAIPFVLAIITTTYVAKYTTMDFDLPSEGIHKEESVELFYFVREKTLENDTFIFFKPRVLSLLGERSASIYPFTQDDETMWNYIQEKNIRYVVLSTFNNSDMEFLKPFLKKNEHRFDFHRLNSDFSIYRVK